MSYNRFSVVDLGSARAGLSTVGYAIYSQSSNTTGSRITTGVNEIVDGKYGVLINFADSFVGAIVWDSGEVSPIYALDLINPALAVATPGDSAGVTTLLGEMAVLLGRLTTGRANNLDNLNQSVSDIIAAIPPAPTIPDLWAIPLPGGYAPHEAGAILAKIDMGAPNESAVVVPGSPPDLTLCRVFGYLETLNNLPASDVEISFTLVANRPSKTEKILAKEKPTIARTNGTGLVKDANGNGYVDLQRNDNITPAGSMYRIICAAAGIDSTVELSSELFDLSDLIS